MDNPIRVVHLSDLHFGSRGHADVWPCVQNHISQTIKPDLVLVTGDIVDSPRQEDYRKARAALDELHIPYRVCAGNHDRHPYGNALGQWWAAIWAKIQPGKTVNAWFDNAFTGVIATVEYQDFSFKKSNSKWTVRVIGLDSSNEAQYSAQGFVSREQLDRCVRSAHEDSADVDLIILMHHHHLLPIAALERDLQNATGLLQPTVMLNAGTVLEELTTNHINLILHGHEHHYALARYGTLLGNQGELVVMGAASATGAKTLEGCDSRRAAFNLLELSADGSAWVQEIAREGVKWTSRPRIRLLDTHAIRRTRFFRSVNPSAPPTSTISKCVEFDLNRNIKITETKTDWTLKDGRWAHITRNSSGWPFCASVEFVWPDGQTTRVERKRRFSRVRDEDHAYRLDIENLPYDHAAQIKLNLQWRGGAVLTKQELACLPDAPGAYRNSGLEYVAIRAYNEVRLLHLLVLLPASLAPMDLQVFYEIDSRRFQSHELHEAIEHHGMGKFSLRIPYPKKQYRYVVAWQPPSHTMERRKEIRDFQDMVRANQEHGSKLLEPFVQHIASITSGEPPSVALYVPNESDSTMLDNVASHGNSCPPSLSLKQNALHRYVWWGAIAGSFQSETDDEGRLIADAGMVAGEKQLVIVPIRFFAHDNDSPCGLVRISSRTDELSSDRLLASGFLAEAALKMLYR